MDTYALEHGCIWEANVARAALRVLGRVPIMRYQMLLRLEAFPTSLALVVNSLVLHANECPAQFLSFLANSHSPYLHPSHTRFRIYRTSGAARSNCSVVVYRNIACCRSCI